MTSFDLHPRLAADTLAIADWELCRVLRMNDATYPWLVLVPRRNGMTEIIDLAAPDQALLWAEIGRASCALRDHCRAHKLNVAALGNAVAQLHVHVIARFTTDPAWPRPIWGVLPPRPFPPADAEREIARWREVLR